MSLHLVSLLLGAFTVFPCSSLLRSASSHSAPRAAREVVAKYWYEYSATSALESPLNLTSAYVSHKNFAGRGPDSGEESLVFSNVGKVEGASFDMKFICNTKDYRGKIDKVGINRNASIAEMNIQSGTYANVTVYFVDSATQEPVIVPRFFMTVLDIDAGSLYDHGEDSFTDMGVESFKISPVTTLWLAPTHDLLVQHPGRMEYRFTATEVGGHADNPTDAMHLTVGQQNRGAMVEIRNQASFEFDFAASRGQSNRNVMFSGPSELAFGKPLFCLQPGTLDFSSATLSLNNLDGSIAGRPQEMHIRDVELWTGDKVNMTVSIAEGKYEAHNVSKNGLRNGLVTINLKGNGAKVGFAFSFKKSGKPYAITNLLFTFADLDHDWMAELHESYETVSVASGTGAYFLSGASSTVGVFDQDDGFITFSSTIPGTEKNNPTHEDLDDWQKDKAVTLAFAESMSSFTAYFSAKSIWPLGRNILFGGDATMAC